MIFKEEINMNKNDVIAMLERLKSESFFSDFKLKKSDKSLIRKFDWGWQRVILDHYNSFDLERNDLALQVMPNYEIRFNILHKWFEKFSRRTLSDQRDTYSIGFNENMLGKSKHFLGFLFLENRKDYELDYEVMKNDILEHASHVFNCFKTINDLYDYKVNDVLKGKKTFPTAGADWIFEDLFMTRIVNPEQYDYVKKLILEHVDKLRYREHPEPNVTIYYDRIPEIISYLESMSLDDIPSELIHK